MSNLNIDFRGYWELYKTEKNVSKRGSGTLGKWIVTSQSKPAFWYHFIFKAAIEEIKENAFLSQVRYENVTLKTPDSIVLDGIVLPSHTNSKAWAIIFNDANEIYEESPYENFHFMIFTKLNVLRVNYRGTGRSKGKLKTARDLEVDSETIYRYLLSKNVQDAHILVSGRGLGALVALRLRSKFPNGPVLLDSCPNNVTSTYQSLRDKLSWSLPVNTADLDKITEGKIIISRTDDNTSFSFFETLLKKHFFFEEGRKVREDGYSLKYYKERKLIALKLELKEHWIFSHTAAKVLLAAVRQFSDPE